MARKETDYSNPRDVIARIHQILVSQNNWDSKTKRAFARWKLNKAIGRNEFQFVEQLTLEVIEGFAQLYPVEPTGDFNYHAKDGYDPYCGQLFMQLIADTCQIKFSPFIMEWMQQVSDESDHLDYLLVLNLRKVIQAFQEVQFYKAHSHESVFFQLLPENWFVPDYRDARFVYPIEKLLLHLISVKKFAEGENRSWNKLAVNSVRHLKSEDQKESAYYTVEKALDRLRKGEGISIQALGYLRKVPFSKYLIHSLWDDKSEIEKRTYLERLGKSFKTHDLDKFVAHWSNLFNIRSHFIADSTDALFESAIIIAFLLTQAMQQLERIEPSLLSNLTM